MPGKAGRAPAARDMNRTTAATVISPKDPNSHQPARMGSAAMAARSKKLASLSRTW
jgi:hypothetical protein